MHNFDKPSTSSGRVRANLASDIEGAHFAIGGFVFAAAAEHLVAEVTGRTVEDLESHVVARDPVNEPGVIDVLEGVRVRVIDPEDIDLSGTVPPKYFKAPFTMRELVPPPALPRPDLAPVPQN
jgi:hypothetical protein